jgi:hypothetical protein
MCAHVGYRNIGFETISRDYRNAEDDAHDLKSPIAGLRIQIAILNEIAKTLNTGRAEDAMGDAIQMLEEAISSLELGATRVIDDANENEGI